MLDSITVKNFKKIQGDSGLTLSGLARVNYLVGENGSGKSSVLEAIYLKYNEDNLRYKIFPNTETEITDLHKYKIDVFYNCFLLCHSNNILKQKFTGYTIDSSSNEIEKMVDTGNNNDIKVQNLSSKLVNYSSFQIENFFYNDVNASNNMKQEQIEDVKNCLNGVFNLNIDDLKRDTGESKRGEKGLVINITRNGEVENLEFLAGGYIYLFKLILTISIKVHENEDTIVIMIEEPEQNIHPRYQKKIPEIFNYFASKYNINKKNTSKKIVQFLISTHSPFIVSSALELEDQKVYHIENGICLKEEGLSCVDINSFNGIMDSLGSRPSDILFANGIIWVEGPSDAIYLDLFLKWYSKTFKLPEFNSSRDFTYSYHGNVNAQYYVQSVKDTNSLLKLFSINTRFYFIFDSDVYHKDDSRIKYTQEDVAKSKKEDKPKIGDIKVDYKEISENLYEMQNNYGFYKTKRIIARFLKNYGNDYIKDKFKIDEVADGDFKNLNDFKDTPYLWHDSSVPTIEDYFNRFKTCEKFPTRNEVGKKGKETKKVKDKIIYAFEIQKWFEDNKYDLEMPENLRVQLEKLYNTIENWNK